MKKFFTRKNIIILSIITFIILIFSFFYKPRQPLPQLLSSSPTPNSQRVSLTNSIQLKFDQEIDPTLLTVTSVPTEEWNIQTGDSKFIIVLKSKQYLQVATKYSLSILYKNQLISTLNFKTLPQQGDPRYTQQVLQEVDRDYPLAKFTPYNTATYYVVYSAPLTLEITIKTPSITPEKAIADIKSWVASVGGDAAAHKYVISDTPYGPTLHIESPRATREMTPDAKPSGSPFNWDTVKDDGT